jgi:hypothetical protein
MIFGRFVVKAEAFGAAAAKTAGKIREQFRELFFQGGKPAFFKIRF